MTWRGKPLAGASLHENAYTVGRVVERLLPAGLRLSPHTHDVSVLTVVMAEGFEEGISTQTQDCLPGDVRLLRAGDVHTNQVGMAARCLQIEIASAIIESLPNAGGELTASGRIAGPLVTVLGLATSPLRRCGESGGWHPLVMSGRMVGAPGGRNSSSPP